MFMPLERFAALVCSVSLPKVSSLPAWQVVIACDPAADWEDLGQLLAQVGSRTIAVRHVQIGAETVRAALVTDLRPDCLLIASQLPDIDVLPLLAALCDAGDMPICPVVMVSPDESTEEATRVLRAGAQGYVGRAGLTARSLGRAMENATIHWQLARQLRDSKAVTRLVTDADAFLLALADAIHPLSDPHDIKALAATLLGQHLRASRVTYAEKLEDDRVLVTRGYVSGVPYIDGIFKLRDFGSSMQNDLEAGRNFVCSDVQTDPRYTDAEKTSFAQVEVVAHLSVPLLKKGKLVAILGVHKNELRQWTDSEVATVEKVAERTRAAVEFALSESRLRVSEMRLAQMIEIMPSFCAVMRGPMHVFELANLPYYDVSGHGPEILGKSLIEAMPEMVGQPFPALLDEAYQTGNPFHAHNMLARLPRGAGGSLIDVFFDFSYLPLREPDGAVFGILVHGLDRTEHFIAAESLSRQERELRSLADNTPDVLTRFDRQLHHIFVNLAIMTVTGHPAADFIGKTSREVGMPENFCVQWERALNAVFSTSSHYSLEFSFETPLGLRHYSSLLVPELNSKGIVESVLGVTHDITSSRAYEARLLEQDVRKDRFLATLAHELRNPLAPIRSGLQLLKLSPQDDVAARTLPVMERQLGQLVRLIDDLLDVSRISTGKLVLRRERIAFQEVAAAALEASRPVIEAAGHSLEIDWPERLVWLDADPTRLTQIFSNLLTNSAKYMRPGGQIKFSARQLGDSVLISVLDTGMGIPADMLASVFDMFTQINRTLDRAQGGLGIGLSLAKTLVEMHGGSVQAASDGIDLGSEFTVTLPTASAPHERPIPAARPVTPPAAKHQILVVDDNVDAAETMAMLLELSGHEVRTAFGGQEALETALTFRPDVVFLDIGLPGMNGYEVAKKLLADPATARARLIALTGWGTQDDIQKSKMAGFHAHLTKPVDPDAVEAMIATLFPGRDAA